MLEEVDEEELLLADKKHQPIFGTDSRWGQGLSCLSLTKKVTQGIGAGTNADVDTNTDTGSTLEEELLPEGIKPPVSAVDINKTTAQIRFEGRAEELDILEGELASIQELGFAFQRAASRMTEMTSNKYRYSNEH